jgi:hypothetical protein
MSAALNLIRQNRKDARSRWGPVMARVVLEALAHLTQLFQFSVANGDLLFLSGGWFVTHTGLLRLAARRRCSGIQVQPISEFSDALNRGYAFKATVYKSPKSSGFVGFGDADPSNVSSLVRGASQP